MEVKNTKASLVLYGNLLSAIKARIRQAQVKATLSANSEMILMYWDIGRMIQERQDHEGWGSAVIPRLARDIRNELPEEKGFSERNIKRMLRFYREYPNILPIMPQAVAQLQQAENKDVLKVPQAMDQLPVNEHSAILQRLAAQIPWGHNILLKDRIIAEYALRDVHKPIGVSEYELTRSLLENLKSSLPSIEEIETELGGTPGEEGDDE